MGYLEGFGVTIRQHRMFGGERVDDARTPAVAWRARGCAARARIPMHSLRPTSPTTRRSPSPSACTVAMSSTGTRTAWRSASAASCAPVCARRSASTCAVPTTTPTTRRRPASASASSTRSTTSAASTATCASRRARPRRSPSRSCSSSRSRTARTRSTPRPSWWSTTTARPQQLPWEDWRDGEDADTSGWMRATSPSGDADVRRRGGLERRARLRRARPGAAGYASTSEEQARPRRRFIDASAPDRSCRRGQNRRRER